MNDSLWKPDQMLEVGLKEPDDFLKVRETLSRIGVASRKNKTLFQSCHILHKQGKYYIVHFKELFALDGKDTNISENDIARRNTIANLLSDWGLINVVGEIAVHKANIITYQTMPAGIGEHSDITEAVIAELDKLAAADDRLEMINKYFPETMNG